MEDLYEKGFGKGRERRGLSVEQKLELSHMLRQEQDYNRLQMDKREMLVYGKSVVRGKKKKYNDMLKSGYGRTSMLQAAENEDAEAEAMWQKMQRRNRISFVTRGFISVLLFVIVLLMRFAGLKFWDVDYQNLMDSLGSEEFVDGMDFEEMMPEIEEMQEMQKDEN
ncbi:MAG: hypothetical protein K2P64_04365 [Lachnospiraceae bacterium]|nr:hypothetical protein [Lachnospiraceae bacterium]